jgi:hypothetical protein
MSTKQPSIQTDKQAVRSLAIVSVFILIPLLLGFLVGAEPLTYFVMTILGFSIGIWNSRRKYPSWREQKIAWANQLTNFPTKRDTLGFILMGITVSLIYLVKGPLHGILIAVLLGILLGWALGGFVWEIVLYLRRNRTTSAN